METCETLRKVWLPGILRISGLIALVIIGAGYTVAQQPPNAPASSQANAPPSTQGILGATYGELLPEQKVLVDDWFQRVSVALKKSMSAEEGYNSIPLSYKTTFSAVTHALIHTPLTDKSGVSMGASAIILIDKLDTVAGQIPEAKSDQQFRIYIQLKPGALDILARSQEFARGPDNTVFHEGYPTCYRSTGGTPSLQVSSDRNGDRADVDVDYRSSKFPVFLINGHLSASNSDIRAGNNDERHNQHWAGMSSWWRSILGLPLISSGPETTEDTPVQEPAVKASAKPEIAVRDFLNTWLVDQRPDLASSYFAQSSFSCMEIEQGKTLDLGVARFSMLMGLRQVNERIGKVTQLSDATSAVRVTGPRARVIPQPYESEFILYDVREDLAEQMKCTNQLDPSNMSEKTSQSKSFGKYIGAVFQLKAAGQVGRTVAALWAKQSGYWKLISYDVDPMFERYRAPDATPAAAASSASKPAVTYVAGDKDLTQAATDFLSKWLVQGQPTEAFQYLSTRAYACVNLYRDDDTLAPGSPAEAGQLVLAGMKSTASFAGSVKKLESAIVAPEVSHPDVMLVKHSHTKAFALASVPDNMAAATSCQDRQPGQEVYFAPPPTGKVYGNYYATGLRMVKSGNDGAILWAVWARESGQWKIVSYFLITP